VEWSGVEWSGVEWSGVEWSGVEWSGVEWSGVEWNAKQPHRRNECTRYMRYQYPAGLYLDDPGHGQQQKAQQHPVVLEVYVVHEEEPRAADHQRDVDIGISPRAAAGGKLLGKSAESRSSALSHTRAVTAGAGVRQSL
jgi:hypothetical protein